MHETAHVPASPSVTGPLKGVAVGLYFVRRAIQAYVRAVKINIIKLSAT